MSRNDYATRIGRRGEEYVTRVVHGRGAAAGQWVVEISTLTGWRQASLPDATRAEARETAAIVRDSGPLMGIRADQHPGPAPGLGAQFGGKWPTYTVRR